MLEFVITNYMMFIIAAIVLLLGLFGYMMDKKKYKQYREEIVNEQKAIDSFENAPDIDAVATPVLLDAIPSANVENNTQSSETIQN